MAQEGDVIRRGIYNVEYFSGAQVSLYIGDVWVDEITTLNYGIMQNRQPIYGYASELYDGLSRGNVLVQGTFTINFKEAGYLWLILNRYRGKYNGTDLMEESGPFSSSGSASRNTVERIVNGETSTAEKNRFLQSLSEDFGRVNEESPHAFSSDLHNLAYSGHLETAATQAGFSSSTRFAASLHESRKGRVGRAENLYESFEDAVWGKKGTQEFLDTRRADDPRLNPFDIYVAFGDFAGDNSVNHTIEKIDTVSILGKSKQIVIDGMPIQEQYQFIARNLI